MSPQHSTEWLDRSPESVVTPIVFVNYRIGDAEASAALIERELSRRFGPEKIFRAERSTVADDNIEITIMGAVRRCQALVAVIGPRWLTATDDHGSRAIDSVDDWTRREIVEAFRHGVRVIPVLLGKIPSLTPSDVPPVMDWLPGCKYLRLNYRDIGAGLGRLADELVGLVPGLAEGTRNEPARPQAPGTKAASHAFNGSTNAKQRTV